MKFVGTVQGMGRWAAPKKVYKNLGLPPPDPSLKSSPKILIKQKGGGFKLNSFELEGQGGKLMLNLSHFLALLLVLWLKWGSISL